MNPYLIVATVVVFVAVSLAALAVWVLLGGRTGYQREKERADANLTAALDLQNKLGRCEQELQWTRAAFQDLAKANSANVAMVMGPHGNIADRLLFLLEEKLDQKLGIKQKGPRN